MATLVKDSTGGLLDREALGRWLVEQGLAGRAAGEVFQDFCAQLSEAGIPILRGYSAMLILHPLYQGFGQIFGGAAPPAWRRSNTRPRMRARNAGR